MDFRQQLLVGMNELVKDLEDCERHGRVSDTTGVRLEVLCEAALVNGDIPLEAIDLMNEARRHLNETSRHQCFRGYETPVVNVGGRRGRPKFSISEELLQFFRGRRVP